MILIDENCHLDLLRQEFLRRGYCDSDAYAIAMVATEATEHGVHSHSGIKALDLDDKFGSLVDKKAKFEMKGKGAVRHWDGHCAPGPGLAITATTRACVMAREFGVGLIAIQNCSHYLWGGSYALDAAKAGFVFFTTCTGLLAEVIPHGGERPSIGTNPHTWALPTTEAIGFPILVDWATSKISMAKAQMEDPFVKALHPMGGHKGWGLGFLTELLACYVGSAVPSKRCRDAEHPAGAAIFLAIDTHRIKGGPDRINETVQDILHDNPGTVLPGQKEHEARLACEKAGGLLIPEGQWETLQYGIQRTT